MGLLQEGGSHLVSPAASSSSFGPHPPGPQPPTPTPHQCGQLHHHQQSPREAGSDRSDGLHVWPSFPFSRGRSGMTSQTPQGGDQVTVGTQLPRKSPLSLPPAPSLHKNWGTCLPHPVAFLMGDCSRGHQLHKLLARPTQAAKAEQRCCTFPHPSKPEGSETWKIDIFTPGPRATGRVKADGSLSRPNLKAPT